MVDRNKIGPVTRDQILILLRRRVLKGHTPVWNSSLPRYVPLETLDDLAPYVPDEESEAVPEVEEEAPAPPLKGFTRFLVPKKGEEKEETKTRTKAPFQRPHKLADEEAKSPRGNTQAPIPGAPSRVTQAPMPQAAEEPKESAVKQMRGAVSEGMRLLGATSLSIGAAVFGVFVLGLIDLLIGAQRDVLYDNLTFLLPLEFLTLLDPVEWMGVLIVGGLVGSAASAGCGGRGNATVAAIAALCAFFSVSIGAIFAEILAISVATDEPLSELVLHADSWIEGVKAFFENLTEEPDDLLFLFGAAGEAFLISRHDYRKHEDEDEKRIVDPFLKT
ncbi:hypothetical protein [Cerasicoccus fimbriatus]|uniref:hypothetical protein n=1 Tax=Cerasicoccus fimbriatus TaxID=3014554 RepID=UPI0022B2B7B0|nr:hypothetical protein [Cerasicoccus sp. TK19100]